MDAAGKVMKVESLSTGKLRVTVASGASIDADHVIFSAPLGALKAKAVSFNPALPQAKLDAIANLEGGSEAMANYFADKWGRIEAFARTGTFDTAEEDGEMLSETALFASAYAKARVELEEVADQDWMQLAWLLRYECPDLFIEMLLVMRAKARAHDLGLEQDEDQPEDDGKVETGDTDRGHATPAARDDEEESAI